MTAAAGSTAAPLDRKALATQTARGALVGVTVYAMRDDRGKPEYIATRWALTKAFSSLADLAAWLDRVGAPK